MIFQILVRYNATMESPVASLLGNTAEPVAPEGLLLHFLSCAGERDTLPEFYQPSLSPTPSITSSTELQPTLTVNKYNGGLIPFRVLRAQRVGGSNLIYKSVNFPNGILLPRQQAGVLEDPFISTPINKKDNVSGMQLRLSGQMESEYSILYPSARLVTAQRSTSKNRSAQSKESSTAIQYAAPRDLPPAPGIDLVSAFQMNFRHDYLPQSPVLNRMFSMSSTAETPTCTSMWESILNLNAGSDVGLYEAVTFTQFIIEVPDYDIALARRNGINEELFLYVAGPPTLNFPGTLILGSGPTTVATGTQYLTPPSNTIMVFPLSQSSTLDTAISLPTGSNLPTSSGRLGDALINMSVTFSHFQT